MYAIKATSRYRSRYFKSHYTNGDYLHIVYSDKLEYARIFDSLDAAIHHMMMIAFGVPVKYFMEMQFCIVEVQHSYKEL